MSMTFHAPVPLLAYPFHPDPMSLMSDSPPHSGANLEVTSTTVSVGGRAMSAVTEARCRLSLLRLRAEWDR